MVSNILLERIGLPNGPPRCPLNQDFRRIREVPQLGHHRFLALPGQEFRAYAFPI